MLPAIPTGQHAPFQSAVIGFAAVVQGTS